MKTVQDNKKYLQWLNDAYSMELSLIPVLENHAKDAANHGFDGGRISQHVNETRGHAESLKVCIERLGGDVSTAKTMMGKAMGKVQSVATGPFKDELIKNALSDFSAENMEIASYTSLIAAAEDVGDTDTAEVCRKILEDEISMANWLKDQIPEITQHVMHKD